MTSEIKLSDRVVYDPMTQLRRIAAFGDNWDSYGSRAVKKAAAFGAEKFIKRKLRDNPEWYPYIYPTCSGNVGIEWIENQVTCTVLFDYDSFDVITEIEGDQNA